MAHDTVLIVDDNPENLTVLGELLRGRHRVRAAASGQAALQAARRLPRPSLVLLDVMMPGMNGYEVLRRLRESPETADIPVIFTTAMDATEDEEHGLALGAVDYLTKPLRPAIVLARVQTHLELKHARDRLRHDNAALGAEVDRRVREIGHVQEVALRALARLAETRDNETGNHLLRTQATVERLAQLAHASSPYAGELDARRIELIAMSAPLHDIGKVGIPDRILLKPGKLDADEWAVMKTHAQLGADAIARAIGDTHQPAGFLAVAHQIALHHHERWDGSGYPDGLAGTAIPLSARLMAIADVFDALLSRRVYKRPLEPARVRETMSHERGRHFDPVLLDLFLEHYAAFCELAGRFPDEAAPAPP